MDKTKGVRAILKTRSVRKLTILSAILTAVLLVVTLVGSFLIGAANEMFMLNVGIDAIPNLMKDKNEEAARQYEVYTSDYAARGELAALLYNEYDQLGPEERLEFVRKNVNAIDVTLLDGDGKMVASASGGKPSRAVTAAIKTIAKEPSGSLYDPNLEGINEKMDDEDGYVPDADSMPMVYGKSTSDGNTIVVEFDYTAFGQILAEQSSWDDICQRALAGMEGYVFVISEEGNIGGYPLTGLDDKEIEQLNKEVRASFGSNANITSVKLESGLSVSYSIVSLLDEEHLVAKLRAPAAGYDIILAIPVNSLADDMILCDVAIISLVVVGFFLFSRYAVKSFRRNPIKAENDRQRAKVARRRTRAGIVVVVVVTGVLTSMLLMLEGMSSTAEVTIAQQEAIDYEVGYREQRRENLSTEYLERYTTRANAIARLLTNNPELRTRETLQELSKISQVEYLMLFDKNGDELFSSNGYIGFSVNDEGSGGKQEWKPVLKGYGQIETPTEKNEVTGQYEHTIATLIEDEDGLPDGFLVMAVNDDDYMAEVDDASLEGIVSGYTARDGQEVAVVDNETGLFTAHTNESMVGETAANYLDPNVLGRNYEGYTAYADDDAYVSAVSTDGRTTLVITKSSGGDATRSISWCMFGITLLLIVLFFYPAAASLCDKHVRELPGDETTRDKSHPMMTFYRGYVAYIAVLAVVSFFGGVLGSWTAFEFVHTRKWTPGIHLFSVWDALFVFAFLSYLTIGLHGLIGRVDKQANAHTRTFARIGDSLVTYTIFIIMVVMVLSVLGVDTATIIGSVSIVSIAIGMGAQDLVKDIVAGFFLISEDTINVGDIVEIGGWRGRVTDMGIRTTEITNESNDVKIITNSRIGDVINLSKVKTACTEEFELPRTVELAELPDLVASYIQVVGEEIPEVKDSLKLDEITSISEDSYTVRLSYSVNEVDRESVTIRLRNAMLLLLET